MCTHPFTPPPSLHSQVHQSSKREKILKEIWKQEKARGIRNIADRERCNATASSLQNLNAQIRLVELFLEGYGSPYDYEDAYHWLYNSVTDDKQKHQQIAGYLSQLEALMHPKAVRAARRPLDS